MTTHIGLIGGGNISNTHARAAREVANVEVVAVWGTNPGKVGALVEQHKARGYTDLEKFLQHRPLDMVVIGSPSGLHAEHGIAAARHGLHVLVEKPIDINTDRADALISECERAGVKLGVIFQDRFSQDILNLKQIIDEGALGQLLFINASVKWYRPPEYYADSRWRGTWRLDGGGVLINQAIHTVDLMLWLLGDAQVLRAKTATRFHDIETEDTASLWLEFPNSVMGTLQASTACYPGYPRRVEITGTEGSIVLQHDRIVSARGKKVESLRVEPQATAVNASAFSPLVNDFRGHQRAIEDFINAINQDGMPACDGAEGRRSLALVQTAYHVASQSVTIPNLLR